MTESEFFVNLQSLSVTQLDHFHEQLKLKIKDKQERLKNRPKMLSPSGSVTELADNLGLDLSALVREIAKR